MSAQYQSPFKGLFGMIAEAVWVGFETRLEGVWGDGGSSETGGSEVIEREL